MIPYKQWIRNRETDAKMTKVISVINSAKTPEQLNVAANLAIEYIKKYGYDSLTDKLYNIYKDLFFSDEQPTKRNLLVFEFISLLDKKFYEISKNDPSLFDGKYNRGDIKFRMKYSK